VRLQQQHQRRDHRQPDNRRDRPAQPSFQRHFTRNIAYDGHALGLALALAVAGPGAYSLDALRRR